MPIEQFVHMYFKKKNHKQKILNEVSIQLDVSYILCYITKAHDFRHTLCKYILNVYA